MFRLLMFQFAVVAIAANPLGSEITGFFRDLYRPMPFVSNRRADQPFGTYLVLNVNEVAVGKIRKKIENLRSVKLEDRGEAHITVLTPPEYDKIKASHPLITMESLEKAAGDLQRVSWKALGIGSNSGKNPQGDAAEVFYLVVESVGLIKLREEIARQFLLSPEVFDPHAQDLHVTIGFVVSDLHNVRKNRQTIRPDLAFGRLFPRLSASMHSW